MLWQTDAEVSKVYDQFSFEIDTEAPYMTASERAKVEAARATAIPEHHRL
jgi:hypothetical protein